MRTLFAALFLFAISCAVGAQAPAAPALKAINAITFGGGYSIPAWIAQRQGFFAKNGVAVNLVYTPNSVYLMTSLIEGKFDMALTSIDNLIAYQEGQGEAPVKAPVDLAAFMGMDNAFLYLITAPSIKTFADLRGKELSVDAMSTGFAFVLREMVNRSEIKESEITYVRAGGSPNRFRNLLEGKHAGTLLLDAVRDAGRRARLQQARCGHGPLRSLHGSQRVRAARVDQAKRSGRDWLHARLPRRDGIPVRSTQPRNLRSAADRERSRHDARAREKNL